MIDLDLASQAAEERDRWLPLFWAVNNFKGSQVRHHEAHGDWVLPPVNEARVPGAAQAHRRFADAMDNWD